MIPLGSIRLRFSHGMTPSLPPSLVKALRLDATPLGLAGVGHVSILARPVPEEGAGARVRGPSWVGHCAMKHLLPFASCLAYV